MGRLWLTSWYIGLQLDSLPVAILCVEILGFHLRTSDVRTTSAFHVYKLLCYPRLTVTICSRHDYPAWLYETWTAPGPLDDLFPRSQAKRTSAAALASNMQMALPPSSETKRYDKSVHCSVFEE
jgi:hypothetical protein